MSKKVSKEKMDMAVEGLIDGKKRPHEFKMYSLWWSLPPIIKNNHKQSIEDIIERFHIDDEDLMEVISIKTKSEFQKKYNVSPKAISEWTKQLRLQNPLDTTLSWTEGLIKNVMLALYTSATNPSPKANKDRELFLKVVAKYQEKISLQHGGLAELMSNFSDVFDTD